MLPENLTCPTCGASVPFLFGECPNCGGIIVPPAAPVSLPCPACQQFNAPEARFCSFCGLALTAEALVLPVEPPVLPEEAPVSHGEVPVLSEDVTVLGGEAPVLPVEPPLLTPEPEQNAPISRAFEAWAPTNVKAPDDSVNYLGSVPAPVVPPPTMVAPLPADDFDESAPIPVTVVVPAWETPPQPVSPGPSPLLLNLAWFGLSFGLVLIGLGVIWVFFFQNLSFRGLFVAQPSPEPLFLATTTPVKRAASAPLPPPATATSAPTFPPATLPPTRVPTATLTRLPPPATTVPWVPLPSSYECADLNNVLLHLGAWAKVEATSPEPAMYTEPEATGANSKNFEEYLHYHQNIQVIDGPRCLNQQTWWKVRSESGNTGWTLNSRNGLRYLPNKRE